LNISRQELAMKRFQILSLVGGGIRGAFVTSYLRELEQNLGRPIAECFDLIAGTSTGGIIAAGLALGHSAEDLYDFYKDYGPQIFSPREPYQAPGLMRFVFPLANRVFKWKTGGSLDAAFRARFCPFALQEAFDQAYGDLTLKDVTKTRLIIPAVNLTQGEPHVFRSLHLPRAVHDQDVKISDIVIAATAAPTYFPHRRIKGNDYVDGGIWSNDPSVLGFAEAMRIQHFEQHKKEGLPTYTTDEIHLLSIGTGKAQYSLAPPGADAGLIYWAPRMADIMGTAQTQGVHLPLKFLLGDRYQHINFKMREHWPLEATEYIPDLFQVGKERAKETFARISESFLQHQRLAFTPFTSTEEEIKIEEFGFQ
jgi:patatin-like phospholipase/acyl hydrolase